jgi:hypothetical protein
MRIPALRHLFFAFFSLFFASCAGNKAFVPDLSALERPEGFSCQVSTSLAISSDSAFARALRVVKKLRLTPAIADPTKRLILIAGTRAPNGKGSMLQQASRLYLRLEFSPPDSGNATNFWFSPGISSIPRELPPAEESQLYVQAAELGEDFLMGANWSVPNCLRRKRVPKS